jgi:large subunit ribosomal protein L9
MKVLLLQDQKNIGKKGDIVDVSDGFAFNNLIPQKRAQVVTKQVLQQKRRDELKAQQEAIENKEAIRTLAKSIDNKKIIIHAQAKGNKLFGSVTAKDIAMAINEQLHVSVPEKSILLTSPFKELTTCTVGIDHGHDIHSSLILTIAPK